MMRVMKNNRKKKKNSSFFFRSSPSFAPPSFSFHSAPQGPVGHVSVPRPRQDVANRRGRVQPEVPRPNPPLHPRDPDARAILGSQVKAPENLPRAVLSRHRPRPHTKRERERGRDRGRERKLRVSLCLCLCLGSFCGAPSSAHHVSLR